MSQMVPLKFKKKKLYRRHIGGFQSTRFRYYILSYKLEGGELVISFTTFQDIRYECIERIRILYCYLLAGQKECTIFAVRSHNIRAVSLMTYH